MYIRRKVYSDVDFDYGYDNEEPRYYSVIMSEDELRMFTESTTKKGFLGRSYDWAKGKAGAGWDLAKKHPVKSAGAAALALGTTAGAIYGGKKLVDRRRRKLAEAAALQEQADGLAEEAMGEE